MKTNPNPSKAYSPIKQKSPSSLIVEIDYNKKLQEFPKVIEEIKELKINKKQESVKNEEDDISILYYEDKDLKNLVNKKEFTDKEYNIVNKFLTVEEEENLLKKNNSNINVENNFNYKNGSDNDDIVLNQINSKVLFDDEFQPGLFTTYDFKDKIKSLIYNSLSLKNTKNKFDYNHPNKFNFDKKLSSSFSSGENDIETNIEDKDGFILDMCLKDKDIESDNIVINFNDEVKEEEKKVNSILDEDIKNFEGFIKSEAVPEYENQIIAFQNYYQIEHKEDFAKHPIVDEVSFDTNSLVFLDRVSKEIQDKGLKNKIELIKQSILYKDTETKKPILDNKEKNELLSYWKNSYINELEEAKIKERNKILEQKLESLDPNNKIIELTRKKKLISKKSATKRSSMMYKSLMEKFKMNNNTNGNQGIKRDIAKSIPTSVSRKKS